MVLVTGGTGFVGSHLLRRLVADGVTLRAIRRSSSSLALVDDIKDKVQWLEGDVLDLSSLEVAFDGVSHVYHAAAIVSYRKRDVSSMTRVNVEGTANIVNLCLARDVDKLCHVSSIAALGRTSRFEKLNEESLWERSKHNTPYALSKHRAEREVWRGIAEGLNAVIVNPSVVLGPGQWTTGSGRMFRMVLNGLRFYPANATGFVDVRDVADCMIQLMRRDITAQRFILNAENRPMKEVLAMIARALGKRPPAIRANPFILKLSLVYEWLRSQTGRYPRYTHALARNAFSQHRFENDKIREAIGFEFRDLEETIDWTAEELLNHN